MNQRTRKQFMHLPKAALVVALFLWASTSLGQGWQALNWRSSDSVMFDLRQQEGFAPDITHHFPAIHVLRPASEGAVAPLSLVKAKKLGLALDTKEVWAWELTFGNGQQPELTAETTLTQWLHLENVESYTVYLQVSSEASAEWYTKTQHISYAGTQEPRQDRLAEWPAMNAEGTLEGKLQSNSRLERMVVVATPRTEDFRFWVGEWRIERTHWQLDPARHSFFDDLLGIEDRIAPAMYAQQAEQTGKSLNLLSEAYVGILYSPVFLKPAKGEATEAEEKALLLETVALALEYYDLYPIKGFAKDSILAAYAQVRASTSALDFCATARQLHSFLEGFNDPHFRINLTKECKAASPRTTLGPVRLYQFGEVVQVAGVFNEQYAETLPIGAQVVAIDGAPVEKLLAQHNFQFAGGMQVGNVSELLRRQRNEKALLTWQDAQGLEHEVEIDFSAKLKVPASFRPAHARFEVLPGNVAYFYIKSWSSDVFLRLTNHWEAISQANGLVIDLRNNGGGEQFMVDQVLGLFYGKPQVTGHLKGKDFRESKIILPEAHFAPLAQKVPVVLLVNDKTACGSESFIKGMQHRENLHVVGTHNTQGALSAAFNLTYPSGIVLRVNGILPQSTFGASGESIEDKGINPDVWVARTQASDLRPYNDKTLNTAIQLLKAYGNQAPVSLEQE